jgi:hypothetical protein
VLAAEDMAAIGKVQPGDEAFFRVDAVREALNGLPVALIDIGERCATYGAGVNEVEGRDTLFGRRLRVPGAHSGGRSSCLRLQRCMRWR